MEMQKILSQCSSPTETYCCELATNIFSSLIDMTSCFIAKCISNRDELLCNGNQNIFISNSDEILFCSKFRSNRDEKWRSLLMSSMMVGYEGFFILVSSLNYLAMKKIKISDEYISSLTVRFPIVLVSRACRWWLAMWFTLPQHLTYTQNLDH